MTMLKPDKTRLLTAIVIVVIFIFTYSNVNAFEAKHRTFQEVSKALPYGFESVDCWFTIRINWPRTECYYMHVPEDHSQKGENTKSIIFPVVVFRSNAISTKAPVLHLGAGGPGAPMGLDSTDNVKIIWEYHDDISINQGRDLFVIDPRGTGLSKPLLTCDKFVENETLRLKNNLSFIEDKKAIDQDYYTCIEKFKAQKVDLSKYNSLSIANDVEMMRKATKIDQWVLIGVSYAATYAQIIATQYPDSIESMILDSATFPNLKLHDNYFQKTMAVYEALYNYCNAKAGCKKPIPNTEQRIWNLHKELNKNPIKLEIKHPYQNEKIEILLNGERFISSLIDGIYGKQIFSDLPKIIAELEARRTKAITPYLEDLASYLLDTSYGDISFHSHYCYEEKGYTDFTLIRKEANKLPSGYLRDTAILSLDFPDYCNKMEVTSGGPVIATATKTDIPTLFLHGTLDTITPLSDVINQRKSFSHHHLITYKSSHDVLSSEECSEVVAAKFIKNTNIDRKALDCN